MCALDRNIGTGRVRAFAMQRPVEGVPCGISGNNVRVHRIVVSLKTLPGLLPFRAKAVPGMGVENFSDSVISLHPIEVKPGSPDLLVIVLNRQMSIVKPEFL